MFSLTEQLESRRLFSAFGTVSSHGTLSVVGTSQKDSIVIQVVGSQVQAIVNKQVEYFSKSIVKRLWVESFGGNDSMLNKTNLASTLIGDAGNDTIVGGGANDSIQAGSGDDHFDGGLGQNSIDEGAGNDAFDYSSEPGSTFQFDSQNDITITRNNGAGVDTALPQANLNTVYFTGGDDTITSFVNDSLPPEEFSGFHFFLGAGNDTFSATAGSVMSVDGGDGNDQITFGDDGPIFAATGGAGNDIINDNEGTYDNTGKPFSTIDGGSGMDTYNLNPDEDFLSANKTYTRDVPAGIEVFNLEAGESSALVHANGLGDTINVHGNGATIYGGSGNDRITAPNNSILSGNETDQLNSLFGSGGNDTLIGSNGPDVFSGGSGVDTVDYSQRTADVRVTLDNIANDGSVGLDVFGDQPQGTAPHDNVGADVENVIGGSGNDFLQGNPSNNDLVGGAGNDTLWGGIGNDTLEGDAGHDQMFGQDGNDTFIAKDGQTDTLDGGAGMDTAQRDNSASVMDQVLNVETVS